MAFSSKVKVNDAVRGGYIEFATMASGDFTSNVATVEGLDTNDLVFASGGGATGASVTDTDELTVTGTLSGTIALMIVHVAA